ncbi:MAG: PEP-CTERM sorting domain-containing protein [candidate division Zixibacteria bacterium]|nr:PEP-CTERM sorting domain-containing protein [candidate division Zixibacteria bacterium]
MNADIMMFGVDYSDISSPGLEEWAIEGTSMYSGTSIYGGEDCGWIEYQAFLTEGNWNVGFNARNRGYLGVGNYDAFEVINSMTGETMFLDAHESEINHAFVNMDIAQADMYTVRFSWLNDYYDTSELPVRDANLMITEVFFDNTGTPPPSVPEPATLFLLGTGFLGMGIVRRFRRK